MTATTLVMAMVLLVGAGVSRRRLVWRHTYCPVCHRPRQSCTCRWR